MTSTLLQPEIMLCMMLTIAFISSIFAKISRIPNIIALILGGLIIGPDGFQILPLNNTVESFSTIGLVYLMFNIGLEIDLDQLIIYRKRAGIFFLLTYLIPQFSALLVGWFFELDLSSSILLGAIYASYTLVAYPIASQLGILKNEAVALSISASVFSDLTALFILTIILHLYSGSFSWLSLAILTSMVFFCGGCILIIFPYIGRFFFQFFSDGKINFLFVLVVLFASATLAQATGIHAVVGAFLGGLAVNRMVTKESRVIRQVLFTGESIFIPLFIIAIGMRLDIEDIFSNTTTLFLGLTLTLAVYVTKLAAAWIASRLFNYSRPQMWTMWGLTQAQAAATLAIILIATKVGIFPNTVLQASIIMVFFTLMSSPILVKHYGALLRYRRNPKKHYPLLKHILVPIHSHDFPDNTLEFASRLARYDDGKLFILNIADNVSVMETRREKLRAGPMKDPDTQIELINRIEKNDISQSILNETSESEISLIIMDWDDKNRQTDRLLSDHIDNTLWAAKQPVAITLLRSPIKSFTRMIAVIGEHKVGIKLEEEFPEIALMMSKALDLPLVIMTTKHYFDRLKFKFSKLFGQTSIQLITINTEIIQSVLNEIDNEDLVLIPSMGSKDRFDKNPDLVPYNLWRQTKASIIILHDV